MGLGMRTERIIWVAIVLVELIVILGAVLVSLLPEGMKIVGWVILVVLGVAVAATGFLLVSSGSDDNGPRHVWSRTR